MRFFRIPSFTGIEAHRDDADRGSLRMVEGCLPHGPGGLRSGPVWKKIGDVSKYSTTETNYVTATDDGQGNSILFVSRNCKVHDLAVISEENTKIDSFGDTYDVAIPEGSLYSSKDANLTPIGNRIYAVGDGSHEAMFVGKGPENIVLKSGVAPDEDLYEQEWSRFPKCQYFVQGPKKTIFASGNPDRPLTVYISEPAGITAPFRDTPYSSEDTTYNVGQLSTVEILGSNASKITALSTRGDQVVVHTDKGCHLLYAPASDQASTGYRVEQAPATNFSAAVNSKVVSRASGALTYWVGHDGQVYKDEAASRGSEDLRSRADEDQANWKSKGVWEHEHPTDLSNSFAAYSPQSGDYLLFLESEEFKKYSKIDAPKNLELRMDNVAWQCNSHFCAATDETKNCCGLISYEGAPPAYSYSTLEECAAASNCEVCCESVGIADCCYCGFGPWVVDNDCNCYDSGYPCNTGHSSKTECEAYLESLPEGDRCNRYDKDPNSCFCYKSPGGAFSSLSACEESRDTDPNCGSRYSISDDSSCLCVEDPDGAFHDKYECRKAAIAADPTCSDYKLNDCECVPQVFGDGSFEGLAKCEDALIQNPDCLGFEAIDCECVYTGFGAATLLDCQSAVNNDPNCETPDPPNPEISYSIDSASCSCSAVEGVIGTYSTIEECQAQLNIDCSKYSINTDACECVQDESGEYQGLESCMNALANSPGCISYEISLSSCSCQKIFGDSGQYGTIEECLAQLNIDCPKYSINTGAGECECVQDESGEYQGLESCMNALANSPGCISYEISLSSCSCQKIFGDSGQYGTIEECLAQLNIDCPKYSINTGAGAGAGECECVQDESGEYQGLDNCVAALNSSTECSTYNLSVASCSCEKIVGSGGQYGTIEECQAQLNIECPKHSINTDACECVQDESGEYQGLESCMNALSSDPNCMSYDIFECTCLESAVSGQYTGLSECLTALDSTCPKHSIVDCSCIEDPEGSYRGIDNCNSALNNDPFCDPVFWDVDATNCTCTKNERTDKGSGYLSAPECYAALDAMDSCENTYNEVDCKCQKDPNGRGVFKDFASCLDALPTRCPGVQTFYINGCTCAADWTGNAPFDTLEACIDVVNTNEDCKNFILEGCECKVPEEYSGETVYLDWFDYQPTGYVDLADVTYAGKWWKRVSGGTFQAEIRGDGTILINGTTIPAGQILPYYDLRFSNVLAIVSGLVPPITPPEELPEQGTMTYYECLEAIPESCYDKYATPCCEGGSLYGYSDRSTCLSTAAETKENLVYYCSSEGGSSFYDTCDMQQIGAEDYVSECFNDGQKDLCSSCPDKYWDIVNCQCLSELRSEQGSGYTSEELCQAALSNDPSCDTFDISLCECVKNTAGTGEFLDILSCLAVLDVSCPKHSIVDCQCVPDPSGEYQGISRCEFALSNEPICAPHWLVDCLCTSNNPRDGSPSFPDRTACDEALSLTPECNCDNTDRKYNTFEDEGDIFCLDSRSGSGQFTECECKELGYIII